MVKILEWYFSGTKVGTGGCVGQFASPSFRNRTSLSRVFSITVVS